MAQKVIRQLIDDIDGSEAERTFSFAVDGIHYEIDLSSETSTSSTTPPVRRARRSRGLPAAARIRSRILHLTTTQDGNGYF